MGYDRLRVGVVGPLGPDDFADNILSVLSQMGHEGIALGSAAPVASFGLGPLAGARVARAFELWPPALERWQARVIRLAESTQPDVIISVDARLQPSVVAALARVAPVGLWFPDHVGNLGPQVMLSCDYKALFFTDRVLVERLSRVVGLRTYYVPEACNPLWHRPSAVAEAERDRVVLVAGNLHPARARLLERLHLAAVPLRLHSSGWARSVRGLTVQSVDVYPPVYRLDKARAFGRAAAVLNNLHPAEGELNCRLFEAAGCGAVILCEDRMALQEAFDRGSEVLPFSTFDELMDQIHWVFDCPSDAASIGARASVRAHAEHTYQHRLPTLFDVLLA